MRLSILFLCVMVAWCAARARTIIARSDNIEVTACCADEAAVRNLLPEGCLDFVTFRGWKACESNDVKVVKGAGPHGEDALYVGKGDVGIWRDVPISLVQKGGTYLMSCWVKTQPNPPLGGAFGGIGCSLGVWTADWKNGCEVSAHGISPGRWQLVVSEPTVMKTNAAYAQLSFFARGYSGGGWICAPALYARNAGLTVAAKSVRPLRQVRLLSESGETVYDSGVLRGSAVLWKRTLPILPGQEYCVCAIADDGDVACALWNGN